MSKPEKRFFKLLTATLPERTDDAIELFDRIEQVKDDDDVYLMLEKEPLLQSSKNLEQLYELILKSQRSFYAERILGFMIGDELADLRVLYEKAQHKQCRKMIGGLKRTTSEKEEFNFHIELLELEKQLFRSEIRHNDDPGVYSELLREQYSFIEKERNLGKYYRLYAQLKFRMKNNVFEGKETPASFYESKLKSAELRDPSAAGSSKSRLLQMKCRALCYTALKMQDERKKQLTEIKRYVEANDFLFDEMPRQMIDTLYNLANVCIEQRETSKARAILTEMRGLIHSKRIIGGDLNLKLQTYSNIVELLLLTYSGKFTEAIEASQSMTEFIYGFNKTINKEDKSILLFNLINLYIYSQHFNKAEKLLEILLSESDRKGRKDISFYTRMQQLVICYELDRFHRIPLILEELEAAKNTRALGKTEELMLKFFSEIMHRQDRSHHLQLFSNLYTDIKKLMKDRGESWTNFFYFNFFAYSGFKCGAGSMKELIIKLYSEIETD